jgi:Transcription factor WhiB
MSDIFNELNSDEDNIKWWHLSACLGMDTNLFFDKYETDMSMAKAIDQCCLACPVIKMCYDSGIKNNEYGVWGGIYLSSGSIDKMKNIHKDKEIWKEIRQKNEI